MLTDYFFWFSQPSSILNNYDKGAFYFFAGCLALGIALWATYFFVRHPIVKQALSRVRKMFFWLGVMGVIWFGFRYENTPIFSKRFWPGLIVVIGLVWLFFIVKYFITRFSKEKSQYGNDLIKNKYIPQTKR
jgi:hypothetical protein